MKGFIKSFYHAGVGMGHAFSDRNFCIEAAIGALVLIASYIVGISKIELAIVILSIGFVLSLEATNSVIEELCDKFHPETHPHIALIKDMAAGAVLIASIASAAVGIIIFCPYIF